MSLTARRPRTLVLLIAVPLVAAGLGALFAVSRNDDRPAARAPADTPPRPRSVVVGHLQLAVPDGWSSVPSTGSVPGLERGTTATVRGPHVEVTVAELAPSHPSLLPKTLAQRMTADRLRPRVERHGALSAWHYADVLGGAPGRTLDLYVVPTTAGTATVACSGTVATRSECGDALAALRLVRASPLTLGPDAALREALPAVLAVLNRQRAPARAALARARTPREAGAAAERLTRTYLVAVRALSPLAPPSGSGLQLVQNLARLAFEHRGLSIALRAHRDAQVRRAARTILTDERRLSSALGRAG